MKDVEYIVIGAGVLGVSVSYHLAQMGRSVALLEKEPVPAAHSSGKNAGMIRQLYRHPQLTEWTARSIASWPAEIKAACFRETGSIIVGRQVPAHRPDLFVERMLTTRLGGQEKQTPCVYTPTDGLLDSGDYVQQLLQHTDRKLVSCHFRTRVLDVQKQGDMWQVATNSQTFQAPWVINAGGAWLNSYLHASPLMQVNAQPYARHLFLTEGWEAAVMPAEDCGFYWEEEAEWYMRLWDPTTRLVSVCERIPAAAPDSFMPHPEMTEELAAKLLDSIPALAAQLGIARSWHCFRTYTEDQHPIWGEDPHFSGLFWLGAFGGFGMSTSYAASYDAALTLCGRGDECDVSTDFLPRRVKP